MIRTLEHKAKMLEVAAEVLSTLGGPGSGNWGHGATKATAEAVAAGKRAEGFVDKHIAAANLHKIAEGLHKAEGNTEQATEHARSANWHQGEAKYGAKQVAEYNAAADRAKREGNPTREKWNREQAHYRQTGAGKISI